MESEREREAFGENKYLKKLEKREKNLDRKEGCKQRKRNRIECK